MTNIERIQSFKNLIRDNLAPLINNDYVLLDIPNHCNIGDNLIWEGELEFLKEFVPHKCIYSANVFNWEEEKIQSSHIILFHGGGNFGDLYRICQNHRLNIVNKYRNKRIIIFPQTVWYIDLSLLTKDCEILSKHPDITICTRDQKSYDLLAQYISQKKLLLLPDMAFCISKLPSYSLRAKKKELFLLRTDNEIGRNKIVHSKKIVVKDWPTYHNNRYLQFIENIIIDKKNELSRILQMIPFFNKLVDPVYGLNSRNNRARYIKIGVDFLSEYDRIYTTRLHGLILGLLMGKEVTIIDNKYNKCKNFYHTWLEDFDMINIKYDD